MFSVPTYSSPSRIPWSLSRTLAISRKSGRVLLEVAQIRKTISGPAEIQVPMRKTRRAGLERWGGSSGKAAQAVLERRLRAAEVDGKAGRFPDQFFSGQVRAELGKLIFGERLQVPGIKRN